MSKSGSSTPPYTSWETAADSIQKCINLCVNGDTIYVANGVYKEQVVMIPGLSLIGAGLDSCIIDTRALVTAVDYTSVIVNDSCFITGFNILVYYNSSKGYGIKNIGNGVCLITLNKITSGGLGTFISTGPTIYKNVYDNVTIGIWLFTSNSIVRKNIIYIDPNAISSDAYGILIEATSNGPNPVIDSNYIEVNRGEGIYKSFGTNPTISNNTIILKHIGTRGIRLSSSDSAKVYNNSIYAEEGYNGIENNATQFIKIYNNYLIGEFSNRALAVGPDNKVKNNVVTNSGLGAYAWGNQNLDFKYNNVWNNAVNYSGFIPDSTNISVDPMVVNDDVTRGELDFHLQKYSPLIDAGDPNILDKDGSRSDIGLYGGLYGESYKYLDLAPRAPINLTALADTNYITLNWNKNTEADTAYYKVYRDTVSGFQIDSTKLISSTTDTFFIQVNPHNVTRFVYKVTCVDKQGNESKPSEELIVNITSVSMNGYPMTISDYILYQNYPNPFNPSTTISYRLINRGYVKLYVYDIKGELINVLVNKEQESGFYEVEFNVGSGLPSVPDIPGLASGVYIYQIIVKSENNIPVFSDIKKMLYLK